MGNAIQIRGSILEIKVDSEGYSVLKIEIPSSDVIEAVKLIALTQQPLLIKFSLE